MKGKLKQKLLMIIMIAVITTPLFSAEKMRIAVLDLKAKGVSALTANAATDVIRAEFVNVANFIIVDRSAMEEILTEQGLQQTGCTDQSCAVKLGKMVSARKIIVGEMNKMGESVLLTLRIIDVEKGTSEYSAREKAVSLETIDDAAEKIARKLTQRIVSGEKEYFSPISPLGYYTRSIIPGWGQVYAGEQLKGMAVSGLFLLSGVILYFNYSNYQDKKDAYNYEPLGSDKFKERREDYRTAANYCWASVGLIGLVYLAQWVDIIFLSKPDFGPTETAEMNSGNVHFNICSMTANKWDQGERNLYLVFGTSF